MQMERQTWQKKFNSDEHKEISISEKDKSPLNLGPGKHNHKLEPYRWFLKSFVG